MKTLALAGAPIEDVEVLAVIVVRAALSVISKRAPIT